MSKNSNTWKVQALAERLEKVSDENIKLHLDISKLQLRLAEKELEVEKLRHIYEGVYVSPYAFPLSEEEQQDRIDRTKDIQEELKK